MPQNRSTLHCSANFIVIALIPIGFFIAMIIGYIGLIPLHVPIHSLGVIGFILFVFLLFIRHNANYSICKIRSTYKFLEPTLKEELEKNSLIIQAEKKSVLEIEPFLNNYYKDVRNDNFASVASSIFPMLGILGTFIAIALSMPDFSVSDTAALDREISLLLSGVGSAFFASIYGILLSLIWTYFEKRGLSKVGVYYNEVKSDFNELIWSKEELLIHQHTQEDIRDNKFVEALRETFNIDFIHQLNAEHINSFNALSKNLKSVSAELRTTLSQMDTSTSALDAQNNINSAISEFTQATHSFEKTTKIFSAQLNTSLNRTFEKIDSEVGEIVIKLADFATHVSLESREVQDSIAKYHNMVANHVKIS